MSTHTIDQFILDPKSKQGKVKVTNWKNWPKLQIFNLEKAIQTKDIVKLLDKMCIYETSGEYCRGYRADTILSTDGQTDKVKPVYPSSTSLTEGIITF